MTDYLGPAALAGAAIVYGVIVSGLGNRKVKPRNVEPTTGTNSTRRDSRGLDSFVPSCADPRTPDGALYDPSGNVVHDTRLEKVDLYA